MTGNARRTRRANKKGNTNSAKNTMAPVAVARVSTAKLTGVMQQSGTDRVAHIDDVSAHGTGTVVIQCTLSPDTIGGRLGRTASLFQRVRYNRVRFEIRSQCPTSLGGGYCAGFVADPDEHIKGDALDVLTGSEGSKTANWWQSTEVPAPNGISRDLLYTTRSGDMRLRDVSPGKLLVVVDGKATATGSMTILCHWSATFSEPSVEELNPEEKVREVTMPFDMQFYSSQGHGAQTYRTALISGDNKTYISLDQMGVENHTIWKTPPYVVSYGASDYEQGLTGSILCNYIVAVDDKDDRGVFRPAVVVLNTVFDLTNNYQIEDFIWRVDWEAPWLDGGMRIFKKGDTWIECDSSGEPFSTGHLSEIRRRELRRTGRLFVPVTKEESDRIANTFDARKRARASQRAHARAGRNIIAPTHPTLQTTPPADTRSQRTPRDVSSKRSSRSSSPTAARAAEKKEHKSPLGDLAARLSAPYGSHEQH